MSPWVEIRDHPVYGPVVSDWPDEPVPAGRYEMTPLAGQLREFADRHFKPWSPQAYNLRDLADRIETIETS